VASAIELYLMALLTGGNAPSADQTDPTEITATNPTTATAVTKSWALASGTPQAGTVYRMSTELTGTWEANALAFAVSIGGTWTQFNPAVGAPSFSAGAVIAAWLNLTVRVLSATTARFALSGAIAETASSWTASTGQVSICPLSQTLTIAAGDTIALGLLFGASTAGQAAASYGSTWTCIGAQG
jgi:Protein of unknown function (DUF2793)